MKSILLKYLIVCLAMSLMAGCERGFIDLGSGGGGDIVTPLPALADCVQVSGPSATLSWQQPSGVTVSTYEVMNGSAWATAANVTCGSGTCSYPVCGMGLSQTKTLYLRYKDASGAISDPVSCIVKRQAVLDSFAGTVDKLQLGNASAVGDINGDGFDDVVFRTKDATNDLPPWQLAIFYGGPAFASGTFAPNATISGTGWTAGNVMQVANVTCDGNAASDIVIGQYDDNIVGIDFGYVFIFKGGNLSGDLTASFTPAINDSDFVLTDSDALLFGNISKFGRGLAAGPLNTRDITKCSDFLIGAPGWTWDLAFPDVGIAYMLKSADITNFILDPQHIVIDSDKDHYPALAGVDPLQTGLQAWYVGDIDNSGTGRTIFNSSLDTSVIPNLTHFMFFGSGAEFTVIEQQNTHHSENGGTLPDIDGDGFNEFFLSLGNIGETDVYIFFGGNPPDPANFNQITGPAAEWMFGKGVAWADIDGSGVKRLLIGSDKATYVYNYDAQNKSFDFAGFINTSGQIVNSAIPDATALPGTGLRAMDFDSDCNIDLVGGDIQYSPSGHDHPGAVYKLH